MYKNIIFLMLLTFAECEWILDLQEIVTEIEKKYFHISRCIGLLTDTSDVPLRLRYPSIRMYRGTNNTVELLTKVFEEDCNSYVIYTARQNRETVTGELIQAYKKSAHSRYNNKRYLFLPDSDNDTDASFLETHDMYYLPNLIFIAATNSTYKIIGHNYFHGHKYVVLGIKYEILDIWRKDKGFEKGIDLYPYKIKNMYGRTVRLSMIDYTPYTVVANESGKIVFDGVETRVAAQFVESSNGTWEGVDNPVYLWGKIYDNGTGNGIFGSVLENTADMGFSAIYQWYCHVTECSYPFIYADVLCLAPKPLIISGVMTVVMPFKMEVWYSFLGMFIVCGLFVSLLSVAWWRVTGVEESTKLSSNLFETYYHMFRLQLEQFPLKTFPGPRGTYYRFWGTYTFLIAVFWQTSILSYLTVPRYEDPINFPTDLLRRYPKLKWGANHNVWIESIKYSEDPVLKQIANLFVVEESEKLKERVPKRDFAYFMERLPHGNFALNTYITEDNIKYLRVMEHTMYTGNVIIMLTRGSPYLEELDHYILRMYETGMILRMELEVGLTRMNNKLQTMVRSSVVKPAQRPRKLLVTHIKAALYLYALGIILSIAVFAMEVLNSHIKIWKQQRQAIKWEKLLSIRS